MIPLEQIRIASPCHASWDDMAGDDQARFCGQCRRSVYNLSEMTRAEAEALVREKEGLLCVRFYTRSDGTVLTQDCPSGLRAVRVKAARRLSYAAAVLLSCGAGLLRWTGTAQAVTPVRQNVASKNTAKSPKARPQPTHTMGKPAVPHKALNPAQTRTMGKIAPPTDRGGVWVGGLPSPVMGAPAFVPPIKARGK